MKLFATKIYVSRSYLNRVKRVASDTFWTFFLGIHTQSMVAIDAALQSAKKTFLLKDRKFYGSKRGMLRTIRKLPPFWNAVTHSVQFNLEQFGMPDQKMTFRFLNPIWAWLLAARRQNPESLLWNPYQQVDRASGERVYGGGVQYGNAFHTACQSCPIGTYPMGISLHWDGTNANGMYCTPIAIAVANINSASASTRTCIGYMPSLSGMGRRFSKTQKARDIRHYIRQKCIGSILSVLEEGARRGVRCILRSTDGSIIASAKTPVFTCTHTRFAFAKTPVSLARTHVLRLLKHPFHLHTHTFCIC